MAFYCSWQGASWKKTSVLIDSIAYMIKAELRLYVTQLEERRVLSASPVGYAVMDFTLDGALSASRSEASSLSFEHTSVPMDHAMPSSSYGGHSVIQDQHCSGNQTNDDDLMAPLSLETEPSVHVSITDGKLSTEQSNRSEYPCDV